MKTKKSRETLLEEMKMNILLMEKHLFMKSINFFKKKL